MASAGQGQGQDPSHLVEFLMGLVSLPDEETLRSMLAEAGTAQECRTCPVCQGIRRLRDTDPAIVEEVSTVATRVVRGFMAAVEAAGSRRMGPSSAGLSAAQSGSGSRAGTDGSADVQDPPGMQQTSDDEMP